MNKSIIVLCCYCICFKTSAAAAFNNSNIMVFTTLNSETYAEAQPIKSFVDKFNQPLTKGDSAFTYNQFEIGVAYKNFKYGFQSRYDYVLKFDPDTALYTYLEKNDLPFEKSNYHYFLNAKSATTNGLFISYDYKLAAYNLTITPKISVFSGKHFQDGNVDGIVFGDKNKGAFEVDYYFSTDKLFKSFTPNEKPQGIGVSFDVAMEWQYNQNLTLGLSFKDLYYGSNYKNAGFVKGIVNDIPFQQNSSGNVTSVPTVDFKTSDNGNEIDHTLTMPIRSYAFVNYKINESYSMQVSARKINSDVFTQVIGRWHYSPLLAFISGYEFKSKAWLIAFESEFMGLKLQTDTLDFNQSYYASVNWYIKIHF